MSRIVYIVFLGAWVMMQACSSPERNSSNAQEPNTASAKSIEENKTSARGMMAELLYEEAPGIVATAQAELLKNVAKAMQAGGPPHAVDFCNVHASGIFDSLSQEFNVAISRVSDKNRNPIQAASEDEKKLLAFFDRNRKRKDTLLDGTYYKPIVLGMPTCLKCHGKPGSDIDNPTLAILNERYPNDLAKDYAIGDMRGMWKIELEK